MYCPVAMCHSFCQSPIVTLGNRLSILSGGGEVLLEWGEEVTYHRNTPCPPQQLVSPVTTKVGNISVMVRKAK